MDINLTHSNLARGLLCPDGQYRQIVTVEDAVRGGCNLFDLDQLRMEYSPDEYQNLLMCEFVDDLASVFPLSELQACMVDSWEVWTDFRRWRCARLAGAKCGSVMTRQKVRRTVTAQAAWLWHRQLYLAGSSEFWSVISGAGWTFAPRLMLSKN